MSSGLIYPTGWRQDIEVRQDQRAYLHGRASLFDAKMFKGITDAPPAKIDPRGWLTIEDQGQMGSCSGHSQSTILEYLNYVGTKGKIVQLSRMYAYIKGQQYCNLLGQGDTGATISGSVRGATEAGICLETTFRYPNRYTAKIPAGADAEAALHKLHKHSILQNYSDVFAYIATGIGAVQSGIPVGMRFQNCKGVYTLADAKADARNPLGGHALAIPGYVEQLDSSSRNLMILINSWNKRWADNGTCLVEPACFDFWGQLPNGQTEMIGETDIDDYDDGVIIDERRQFVTENPWAG